VQQHSHTARLLLGKRGDKGFFEPPTQQTAKTTTEFMKYGRGR